MQIQVATGTFTVLIGFATLPIPKAMPVYTSASIDEYVRYCLCVSSLIMCSSGYLFALGSLRVTCFWLRTVCSCAWPASSCSEWGASLLRVGLGLLRGGFSFVAEHRL